jgi:tubulin polyglutamylase TTLL4
VNLQRDDYGHAEGGDRDASDVSDYDETDERRLIFSQAMDEVSAAGRRGGTELLNA